MKQIGIKLADGSFYPIINEGAPSKQNLDLTTATDDQTTVMVDLYRSQSGTMDGAEYIETLQLDELAAKPNGETSLLLDVSLDESEDLQADLTDPETGKTCSKKITNAMFFSNSSLSDFSEQDENNRIGTGAAIAGLAAGTAALAFAANSKDSDSNASEKSTEEISDELSDFSDLDIPDDFDFTQADSFDQSNSFVDSSSDALSFNDTDSFDSVASSSVASSDDTLDFPEFDVSPVPEITDEDFADFNEQNFETVEASSDSTSNLSYNSTDFDSFSSAFSDFSDNKILDNEISNSEISDSDFDLDLSEDIFTQDTATKSSTTAAVGVAAINADNNEQEEGNMATNRQSEKEIKKKTKVPVLICIICALICVIAAILLLLLRYNVFSGFSSKEHERPVVTRIEPNQVLSSENEIPPPPVVSKVNEIVVPPTPQAVVPQVPVSTVQSSNDIIYRIKWGDTLWDISNAYYRNPWKYTRIARYNNIKNPDYIVSGTTIRIPAE